MKTLAQTTKSTKATPNVIFKLWEDIDHWSEFDQGIEWAKLTDNFAVGGRYTLKPKGGPTVKAIITELEPDKKFVDVSQLPGAKITFDHTILEQRDGATVSIVMSIDGPLAWLWARILGKNQQADLEKSIANLIAKAEGRA